MLQLELNEVLEDTADAAFCVDPQGEICFWNTSARDLLGYTASEAVGKNVHALLRCRGTLGTEICTFNFYTRQVAAENCKISNFDVLVRARSGHKLWLDLSTLIFNHGRTHPRMVVHLARNITKRKQQEDLLHNLLKLSKEIVAMSNCNGAAHPAPVSPLSEQEQRILRLFSEGKNSAEIAKRLGITLQTLRNHLHHANEKLGTRNRLEAVTHAMHRNLI
jgi:PAS domain S-box-containing protein